MSMRYTFPRLSRSQQERLNAILLEELDAQRWFAIAFLAGIDREVILLMQ